MEQLSSQPPDFLRLQYPAGWEEVFRGSDALDYQLWLADLTRLTQQAGREPGNAAPWMEESKAIANRWQRAIEVMADAVIAPDGLTGAQSIRAAFAMFTYSINNSIEWGTKGLAFPVLSPLTGREVLIDLRELSSAPETGS